MCYDNTPNVNGPLLQQCEIVTIQPSKEKGCDVKFPCVVSRWVRSVMLARFHLQTRMIYELAFNQNYYTFTLILLVKIVLFSICF